MSGPPAHGHHTGLFVGGILPPMESPGESPEFDINPPLLAPLLILPLGFLHRGILPQHN